MTNKEFIKDVQEYIKLQYDIELVGQRDFLSLKYFKNYTASNESILEQILGYSIPKYLFNIGLEEYDIDMSYEKFLSEVFNKQTKYEYHFNPFRYRYNKKSSKYQKKAEHSKKLISEEEFRNIEWRHNKKYKDYRKSNRRYRYNSIYYKNLMQERDRKKDFKAECKEYL